MIGDEQSWFGVSRDYLPGPLSWTGSLAVQYFVAVAGSMLIGFLPQLLLSGYDSTGLEAYSPVIAFVAFLLGCFLSPRIRKGQAAIFVWVLGALWLVYGMYDSMSGWSASGYSEKTRWSYMLANLFGPSNKCSATECLGELLFTAPFTASLTYSIGAYIAKQQAKRFAKATSKER
jgi:hypothetical protein